MAALPFHSDQRAQAAVLADLPESVAQEAGEFYEARGSVDKNCLKRDCMVEAWRHVLRPYLIGLRDHYPPQARPELRSLLAAAEHNALGHEIEIKQGLVTQLRELQAELARMKDEQARWTGAAVIVGLPGGVFQHDYMVRPPCTPAPPKPEVLHIDGAVYRREI
ncbi:MAG: hypothetical protein E5X86_26560 [Mesorhizobium sp.]|uniref:hypothetical protein n=1 Tax=Mesorhizobium sp. TaxID=1871066 RepID=UPI000FE5EAD7|nr:hypothetical protein [Mesorhizobium sp.]RWJ00547.1 MAG: hypothetical protein EOR23_28525 [Mesorhizobium sp.]TIO14016.1 MAG: hypothetical protein E5X86_26560 [Mesorhizobium sp.]TIP22906.1 MAG: hypothetical protein E5X67_35460 [Mesorhizobium sp.]TIQ18937.1 MAG: hypothetical protein E5X51_23750 [Mesorhizobium sp.]